MAFPAFVKKIVEGSPSDIASSKITKAFSRGVDEKSKTFNPDKRLDGSKSMDNLGQRKYNPDKRLEPSAEKLKDGLKGNNTEAGKLENLGSKLTEHQEKDLVSKGMSPGFLKEVRYSDGVYKIPKFAEKAGTVHPDTKVKYVKGTIDLFGSKIEGTFPKFDAKFTAKLPQEMLRATDRLQFGESINQLKSALEKNPNLNNKLKFTDRQLQQIKDGKTPQGYVWNHNEKVGVMVSKRSCFCSEM